LPQPDKIPRLKMRRAISARSQLKTGDEEIPQYEKGISARSQLETGDDQLDLEPQFNLSSLALSNVIMPTINMRRPLKTQQELSVTTFTNGNTEDYWTQLNQQQQQQMPQIQHLLQQQAKLNNLHAQPTVIDIFASIQKEMNDDQSVPRDDRVVLYNDAPYVPGQAIASTSQLEDELKKLNELFEAGFIIKEQYHKRKRDLNEMKNRSFDFTVPHSDYSFIALSSGKRQRTEGSTRSTNRNIRVFISSTFRDMADEREAIMKKAIPELQKLAKQRGVFLTAVSIMT